MWIISKNGFVSLVQHTDDPSKFRARARRREHLEQTFGLGPDEIIDMRDEADYRFHADVPRELANAKIVDALNDVDYESHAKEHMAGDDRGYLNALMGVWGKLLNLQYQLGRRAG